MADKKTSFVLPTDCRDDLEVFSLSERGELFTAILRYADEGDESEFSDRAMTLFFNRIKRYIDSANENYRKTCLARSDAGAKGGRPKKQKNQMLFEKAKEADTESESDTDTDTDTESECETVPDGGTHAHGENGNVMLTDDEFNRLAERMGVSKRNEYIEKLGDYMASTGKNYKNHYATIRNWFRQDGDKKSDASFDIDEFTRRGMALPVYRKAENFD